MPGTLADLSATELLRLYRARQASPVEAVRDVLKRIEERDGRLNAFRLVDGECALRASWRRIWT